jgi:16S rRNA (uracil1498-N3)-methyltransferase
MNTPRFFSSTPLNSESTTLLTGSPARHMSKALRMQPGDTVVLFDGSGCEYDAIINSVAKSAVELSTGIARIPPTESSLEIELWQGVSKGSRMDSVVQKATELGVMRIRPVLTKHGMVKLDAARADKRTEHWQEVAVSACEQSGRAVVPKIMLPIKLEAALGALNKNDQAVMLVPGDYPALGAAPLSGTSIILIIGPEGGFSSGEEALAKSLGVTLGSMGPRILRTETAPLAALSILQCRYGDMGANH